MENRCRCIDSDHVFHVKHHGEQGALQHTGARPPSGDGPHPGRAPSVGPVRGHSMTHGASMRIVFEAYVKDAGMEGLFEDRAFLSQVIFDQSFLQSHLT